MGLREGIGAVTKYTGFGRSFEHIKVVLSQRLLFLRTKELCSLFHGLFRINEAIREATIE